MRDVSDCEVYGVRMNRRGFLKQAVPVVFVGAYAPVAVIREAASLASASCGHPHITTSHDLLLALYDRLIFPRLFTLSYEKREDGDWEAVFGQEIA